VPAALQLDRFTTERLIAERLITEHEDDLLKLHQDPEVARSLGGKRTRPEVQMMIERYLRHWDDHGYGIWCLRDRGTSAFVGRAGLATVEIEGVTETEVVFALMPGFWGQGLASELVATVVERAHPDLGLDDAVGYTPTGNIAAQRVLGKNGFAVERDIFHAGLPQILFRRAFA
jgi:RimJ/RimL family protein N-acetyltransferase